MWGYDQHAVHNDEVLRASQSLVTTIVPALVARWLAPPAAAAWRDGVGATASVIAAWRAQLPVDGPDLVRALHDAGVNARHLGLVRRLLGGVDGGGSDERVGRLRALALSEMVVRVAKNCLRSALRAVRDRFSLSRIPRPSF